MRFVFFKKNIDVRNDLKKKHEFYSEYDNFIVEGEYDELKEVYYCSISIKDTNLYVSECAKTMKDAIQNTFNELEEQLCFIAEKTKRNIKMLSNTSDLPTKLKPLENV
jgi:ribosome-associated translation inhibitor RaiA